MIRRGQSALEVALVLPVVLTLAVGVLEWGNVLERQLAVMHVTRDAASAASRTRTVEDPPAKARARAAEGLAEAGFAPSGPVVTATMGAVTAGAVVTVELRVPYAPLTGLVPAPRTLRATTTLRMQNK